MACAISRIALMSLSRPAMNRNAINAICPFCERPVSAYAKERGGPDFSIITTVFYHDNGEMHFIVKQPQEEFECPAQEPQAQ